MANSVKMVKLVKMKIGKSFNDFTNLNAGGGIGGGGSGSKTLPSANHGRWQGMRWKYGQGASCPHSATTFMIIERKF